jgi:hypothetical protein
MAFEAEQLDRERAIANLCGVTLIEELSSDAGHFTAPSFSRIGRNPRSFLQIFDLNDGLELFLALVARDVPILCPCWAVKPLRSGSGYKACLFVEADSSKIFYLSWIWRPRT